MGQQQVKKKNIDITPEDIARNTQNNDISVLELKRELREKLKELTSYAKEHSEKIILMTMRMEQLEDNDKKFHNRIDKTADIILDLLFMKSRVDNFRLSFILDGDIVIIYGFQSIVSFSKQINGYYKVKAIPNFSSAIADKLLKNNSSFVRDIPNEIGIISFTAIANKDKMKLMGTYACDFSKCITIDVLPET